MWRGLFPLVFAGLLAGCTPTAPIVDTGPQVNAGVNIVPDAVLASARMTPSSKPTDSELPDLIDVLQTSDQPHYILINLLRNADLVPTLQQAGPYTILAPTDQAFSKLPPGTVDRLLNPINHPMLVNFVKYHILKGAISAGTMLETNGQVPTLAGPPVVIKGVAGKIMINDANVLRSDTAASNGVAHWLDSVLLPPS